MTEMGKTFAKKKEEEEKFVEMERFCFSFMEAWKHFEACVGLLDSVQFSSDMYAMVLT